GKAMYLPRVNEAIWEAFSGSFAARDSVLAFEKQLSEDFPEEKKYSFEEKGNGLVKVYSHAYSEAYHVMLDGMVERRMRGAIYLVGCLWYTAWINAGSPDLDFDTLPETPDNTLKEQIIQDKQLEWDKLNIREEN